MNLGIGPDGGLNMRGPAAAFFNMTSCSLDKNLMVRPKVPVFLTTRLASVSAHEEADAG